MPTIIKFILGATALAAIAIYFISAKSGNNSALISVTTPVPEIISAVSPQPTSTVIPTPTLLPELIYISGLAFSAQAPFGEWTDPVQQDGCEEASVLTAVYWGMGKTFTKSQALEIIRAMAVYQVENYGQARDTSALDTENRLIRDYFSYPLSDVRPVNRAEDIIGWLGEGKLVIVPADGQKLNNPHFTAPGPERHMVVIRGYDKQTREFITNDVGTRHGENYRYSESVLFSAIRDYPTGDHLPITSVARRAIVLWKRP